VRLGVRVSVADPGQERPSADSVVHIEVRDTALADAPSRVVATTDTAVTGDGQLVALADLDLEPAGIPAGARLSVRVHCDVAGDGHVAPGDWVTTQSYPVDLSAPVEGDRELEVLVRRVG
jgi:uncharacterized lipoprotein YbaY